MQSPRDVRLSPAHSGSGGTDAAPSILTPGVQLTFKFTSRKQKSRFDLLGFCNQSKPTGTEILSYLKIILKNKRIWQLAVALSMVLLV